MERPMTVSELARRLSEKYGVQVSPRQISDLFYRRILDDALAPVVGRQRLISPADVPTIEAELKHRGIVEYVEVPTA